MTEHSLKFALNRTNFLTTVTGGPSVTIIGGSVFICLAVIEVHCHWLHSCIMLLKEIRRHQ